MEQKYNDKMSQLGYNQLVCDIFIDWENVKDEILISERKKGSGNGTIHVFLGAADNELRKEFVSYYDAVESGQDTSEGAVEVTHYFLISNVISMLGYVCKYLHENNEDINSFVLNILDSIDKYPNEAGLLRTSSLFKLSVGSNKLRPYFKQFESDGVFTKLIRQMLLPNSSYKVSLYKNKDGKYAAFWLIGFDFQNTFDADSSTDNLNKPKIEVDNNNHLQQIFYGAPGTGKSYAIKKDTKGEDVIRTTFHPDSDYSTFVGAYKPTTVEEEVMTVIGTKAVPVENPDGSRRKESKIVYEYVQQAFLQAYTAAWKKYAEATEGMPRKQYLVIEEINRGNCAQIFGDLFQLLDRNALGFSDYPITADADMKQQLKKAFDGVVFDDVESINALYDDRDVAKEILNGDILLLPNNLYIWATMNTSDQSLFPIDSAFKRRWDWTYRPISNAKKGWTITAEGKKYDWWTFLEKINEKIGSLTSSEDKKLGYFFCKTNDGNISAETFVGKVVFYLWNDVFKDYEFSDSIFNDENGDKLTFDKFYSVKNGEAGVVEESIAVFMNNLGVQPVDDDDDMDHDDPKDEPMRDQKDWTETEKKRFEFWEAFLDYAQGNKNFAKYFGGVRKASYSHWKNFFVPGMSFYLVAIQQRTKNAAEVQVYFDKTNDVYYRFFEHKEEIEKEMGVEYNWRELPGKKSSVISERKYDIDFDNKDGWNAIFDFYIDRLLRMREVFPKYANE